MTTKIYVENWGLADAEFNAERGALSSRELDFAMQSLKDERNTAHRELDAARESIAELEAELERAKAAQRAERSAGQVLFELFRAPFSDLIDERVAGFNLELAALDLELEEVRSDLRRGVAALNLELEEVRDDVERLQSQFDDAEPLDRDDVENMIDSALDQLTITR